MSSRGRVESTGFFATHPVQCTLQVISRSVTCFIVCLLAAANAGAEDRPFVVATQGDAFIAHQNGSDVWSIGTTNLELAIGFDASRALTLQRLFNPATGRALEITAAPAYSVTAGGERVTLTSNGAAAFVGAVAES